MFQGRLSTSEARVFAQLSDAMIRADGVVHEKELAVYSRIGVPEVTPAASRTDTDVVIPEGAFDSAPARAGLLLDLCLIACADGTVSPEERSLLDIVSGALGASPGSLDALVEYAMELTAVIDRGVELQAEGLS